MKTLKVISFNSSKDNNLITTLKQKEYIDSLDAMDISELTYNEARLISKEKEWDTLFKKIYPKLYFYLLKKNNGVKRKYDILTEEVKLSDKKDFTPALLINLCQKCRNSSFEEIYNDMLNRRKKTNKKNNSR